jgi:hypothetical protein
MLIVIGYQNECSLLARLNCTHHGTKQLTQRECTEMDFDTKLELQLEILTLVNNIEKFSKLGWNTASLQNRLKDCLSQSVGIVQASNDSFQRPNINEQRYQHCA